MNNLDLFLELPITSMCFLFCCVRNGGEQATTFEHQRKVRTTAERSVYLTR